MNPPGNLELFRGFIVSTLQQFPDFATAQPGYQPLTTFIGGVPANGPVIGAGGIPQSGIMGLVPGLLTSAIQKQVNEVGLCVTVSFRRLPVGDTLAQSSKVLFKLPRTIVTIYERPDINQKPLGTGLSILFMVERVCAALKYLTVPGSVYGYTNPGYTLDIPPDGPQWAATEKHSDAGYDVWECPFICDVDTPQRT
jgi:hypothetical protein